MKTKMIEMLEKKGHLIGLVIGVGRGNDIIEMHKYLDIDMIYLIDAYKPFRLRGVLNSDYISQYEVAKPIMEKYKDSVIFINKWECDAVDDVPDLLDFIWFDFSYEYNIFLNACVHYFPKLRNGGVFAGNRYTFHFPTMHRALKDFCSWNGLKLNKITNKRNEHNGEWWIFKK